MNLLATITRDAIDPALALLPGKMDNDRARVQMLAMGLQESRFIHRRQLGNGPARGLWQFERGGGVKGVLEHPASAALARDICIAMDVEPGQAVQCKADGGCFVFNVPGLEAAIQEAYDAGAREKCGRAI